MTIAINPGQLRDPLTFNKLSREKNNSGGSKKVELFAFKTLGKIEKMKAYNSFNEMKKDLSQMYKVTIRWSNGHRPQTDMIMYDTYGTKYIVGSVTETDTVRRLLSFEATKDIVSDED